MKNRRAALLTACALALAVAVNAACRSTSRQEPRREPAATMSGTAAPSTRAAPLASAHPKAGSYNVILILIDSLRADMPWNGYARDIAPRLTEFAKRAVNYTHAYSLSSYTAKSVGAVLAGEYPSAMKRDGRFFTRFSDEDNLFISERLQEAGHRTFGGHAHGFFLPMLGMNQGFADWKLLPEASLEPVTSVTSERLTKLAVEMLSDPKNVEPANDKRFFAYFHYLDPHHTYERHAGHPDFGSRPRDLYDQEVHYTDQWVGALLDFIFGRAWAARTAVIVSADHGEGFGEHGNYRHGYELWESLVRVPMLVHLPEAKPHRIDVPRSHLDLAPTIADLMSVHAGPPFRGTSLVPELFGEKVPFRTIVLDLPRCDIQDRRRAVIADTGYKILAFGDDTRWELYNLQKDPEEKDERSDEEPEMLQTMKRIYAEQSKSIPVVEVTGTAKLKGAPSGRRW